MTIGEFKIKVLPFRQKLYRFALRMLGQQAEAEDITQDTFFKLWSKKNELSKYKSLEALAMTITKNLCLDKMKSHNRFQVDIVNAGNQEAPENPYRQTEAKDSLRKVGAIINALPDQQKMIIQLRDIEGFEYEEIAEALDMQVNAIRVNLSRARKTVREQLIKTYDYGLKVN